MSYHTSFYPCCFLSQQFNLSVGMIGVTYLGMELAHAVGILSAGPITDKLVSYKPVAQTVAYL